MNFDGWLEKPNIISILALGIIGLIALILLMFFLYRIRQARKLRKETEQAIFKTREENQLLAKEIRQRIIDNINVLSDAISINPVVPGNTPENITLEGRNRATCLSMIVNALPRDTKSQGIRMAEFIHQLSDSLVHAYGRDGLVTFLIDAQTIILDVGSAAHAGLILNELISNALQYASVPGEKSKINIVFKERDNKLFISVGDNGTGMKSPYIPKFSFGLQLVNMLVRRHKGEMIINSRPGTRIEIILNEYQKAEREVFITPTTRIY